MKGITRFAAALACATLNAAGPGAADIVEITDDLGRKVELDLPVDRVAVFNPWNAELFRAIASADLLVGLDKGTAANPGYWPGRLQAAVIGQNQAEPNYEAIVELRPDVLVIPRNGAWEDAEAQLAPFGIPVVPPV